MKYSRYNPEMDSSENRIVDRVDFETKVHLEFEKFSGFITEYSHNISEGGMFVKSDAPLPLGTVISFEFKLKDDFHLIQGLGQVVWVRETTISEDKPRGMGLRFREVSEQSKELIGTMVQNAIKVGLTPFDINLPPEDATTDVQPKTNPFAGDMADETNIISADDLSHEFDGVQQDLNSLFDDIELPNAVSTLKQSANAELPTEIPSEAMDQPNDSQNLESLFTAPDEESGPIISADDFDLPQSSPLQNSLDEVDLQSSSESSFPPAGESHEELETRAAIEEELIESQTSPKKNSRAFWLLGILLPIAIIAGAFRLLDINLPFFNSSEAPSDLIAEKLETPQVVEALKNKVEDKIEDLTTEDLTLKQPSPTKATVTEEKIAPAIKKEVKKVAPPKKVLAKVNPPKEKPAPKPIVKTIPIEKPAPVIAQNVAPTVSPTTVVSSNKGLSAVSKISWTNLKDEWILSIDATQAFTDESYKHFSLRKGLPREVIILKNIDTAFSPKTLEVNSGNIIKIRTGHHAKKQPPELHIVIDLLSPKMKLNSLTHDGKTLKASFFK